MILENFVIVSSLLFCIGLYGALTCKNFVKLIMTIELLLNAANLNFVAFANFVDNSQLQGQVFAIFVMTLAAAETAIGLAIVLTSYRNKNSIEFDDFNSLKW